MAKLPLQMGMPGAGASGFQTYLDRGAIGWLSQDGPPRRSPAYALQ